MNSRNNRIKAKRKNNRKKRLENNKLREQQILNSIDPDTVEGNSVLSLEMLQSKEWEKDIVIINSDDTIEESQSYFSYFYSKLFKII